MTVVATVVAIGVDSKIAIPNLSLVFVVPVIIAGVSLGLGPALCSAILGSLAFNFFLTEPRYSLAVDDAANIWAIGLLFIVGLIVSGVAFTSRQRAAEAALLRRQVIVLQNYGRDVVAADNTNAIVLITSQCSCSAVPGSCCRDAYYQGRYGFRLSNSATSNRKRPNWRRHDHPWRLKLSCAAASTRIWPHALTFGQ